MATVQQTHSVGKRKSSQARAYVKKGSGKITVNHKPMEEYFTRATSRLVVQQPLVLTNTQDKYDINVNVRGGGPSGQAGATRHAISKAILEIDPSVRSILKKEGLLTRDSREVERKKPGRAGARKRFQFSKR
ncbi:MAG: 30S ribosomal protein S9 [Oligoflexia bacterium]|nr:30S ribosomal protein S9 [Oligoflexia bacterium]